MSKKPILAIDCDGCCSNLIPGIVKMCSIVSSATVSEEDWIHYDYFKTIGMTIDQFLDGHIEFNILQNATIYEGVAVAISYARENGYEVAIVTSRGFHPDGENITREWFKKHNCDVDHMVLVGIHETKVNALKSLGNVAAYIDDYLPHLEDIAASDLDINLFLMDQPWNCEDTQFNRIFSVSDYIDCVIQDDRIIVQL